MAPRPLPLLLLLLLGTAARPAARAPRHSDGTFTSELSRLRDRARLQRLLQGLVGKRSEQDSENGASWFEPTEGQRGLPWSEEPALQAWVPPRAPLHQAWSPWLPPVARPAVTVPEAAETTQWPR